MLLQKQSLHPQIAYDSCCVMSGFNTKATTQNFNRQKTPAWHQANHTNNLVGVQENQYPPSRDASRRVRATICVAVFHFPRLFTATACRGPKHVDALDVKLLL
jgi:hypothetical protein